MKTILTLIAVLSTVVTFATQPTPVITTTGTPAPTYLLCNFTFNNGGDTTYNVIRLEASTSISFSTIASATTDSNYAPTLSGTHFNYLINLTPSTSYYIRIREFNSTDTGTYVYPVQVATTAMPCVPPTAITSDPDGATQTGFVMHGTYDFVGCAAGGTVKFQVSASGSPYSWVNSASLVATGTGNYDLAYSASLANHTYYVRLVVTQGVNITNGGVKSISTLPYPTPSATVDTIGLSGLLTNTSFSVNAGYDAGGFTTTATVQYSVYPNTPSTSVGTETGPSGSFVATIVGTPGTTYNVRVKVSGGLGGTNYSSTMVITLPAYEIPTFTVSSVVAVDSTTITISGTANPNGSLLKIRGQKSTNGTTYTSLGWVSYGSGTADVPFAVNFPVLVPNTWYYVKVEFDNSATGSEFYGADLVQTPNGPAPVPTLSLNLFQPSQAGDSAKVTFSYTSNVDNNIYQLDWGKNLENSTQPEVLVAKSTPTLVKITVGKIDTGAIQFRVRYLVGGLGSEVTSDTVVLQVNSTPSGVDDESGTIVEKMIVFPNPIVDGSLTVKLPQTTDGGILMIFNMLGQAIASHAISESQKEMKIVIPSGTVDGAYLIRFSHDGKETTTRVIVQKIR